MSQDHLAHLKTEVRKTKAIGIVALCAFGLTFLTGQLPRGIGGSQPAHAETIAAQRFVVVDDAGKPFILLGKPIGEPRPSEAVGRRPYIGLYFFDETGMARVLLGTGAAASTGQAYLTFWGPNSSKAVVLTAKDDEEGHGTGHLTLWGPDGVKAYGP